MSGGSGLVKRHGMVTSGGVMIGIAAPGWTYVVGYLSAVMDLCGNIFRVMLTFLMVTVMVMVAGVFVILFLTMAADLVDLLSIDDVLPQTQTHSAKFFLI